MVHQNPSGRVEDTVLLPLGSRLRPEPRHQTRLCQCVLAGLRVQVERTTLLPRGSARLSLVHHRVDAVPMQDPRQRQTAEAATGDRNSQTHAATVHCICEYIVRQ